MNIDSLLHQREEVLILLRRDKLVLVRMIVFYGGLLLFPVFLLVLLEMYAPLWLAERWGNELVKTISILATSLYYMLAWVFFFRAWLDYYLDIWLVTNQRIVSVEQAGLFARTISEQKLYRIQDVSANVQGIIPTLFDYGNVTIQTAGKNEFFIFKEVPRPHQVARNIAKLAEWDKKAHNAEK